MKCRICSSITNLYEAMPNSAQKVSKLYRQPIKAKGVELELFACPVCRHYQIQNFTSDDYYGDYIMTASHSPKMQELQKRQIEKLAALTQNKASFIEIGCGDGHFLSQAQLFFNKVLGIEPSKSFYQICIKKGLRVINSYFTRDLVFKYKFSAFASRQVFEHLDNPLDVLTSIYNICENNAVGLIEVPNAQKMITENRYFDLFTDHINYFTPSSLSYLARKANFEIIALNESFNRDYLELYIRKKVNDSTLKLKRESNAKFVISNLSNYKIISAWGAGAKAQSIMTYFGGNIRLKYLFDSDPHKEGKYIVNCKAKILKPSPEKILENDLIIIFAASYQDEIIDSLKNMGYKKAILCLEDKPCILK